ncbi:MAG: hypothetical protein ABI534_10055 [Chloroflexota bacterium]
MRAFVLRISPAGVDGVPEALASNEISIGWAKADRLTDPTLDYRQFREVLKEAYYADEPGYRDAGGVAGQLWRFIRGQASFESRALTEHETWAVSSAVRAGDF